MKILHLISSSGFFGAERVMIVLSKALLEQEHEVVVGCICNKYNPHIETVEEAKKAGIPTKVFDSRYQFDPKTIRVIKRYIIENNIDIVHSHGYKSNLYALLSATKNIGRVATNHNWLTSSLRLKVYCYLDRLWIKRFDSIVAVSKEIQTIMVNKGVPKKKIRVIDNGIDLERFRNIEDNCKKEFDILENRTVLGIIGNLSNEKGHKYLIDAVEMLEKTHKEILVLVVGDGRLKEQLKNYVQKIGLNKNFIFTGIRKDIPQLLNTIDIFLITSVKEGLPMVLLEAMAAHKTIVATRVGAIPKVITDKVNGMLVPPRKPEEISKAINELIKDNNKRKQLSKQAYVDVVESYSSTKMCKQYVKEYEKVKGMRI